jgi:hypothetical protein
MWARFAARNGFLRFQPRSYLSPIGDNPPLPSIQLPLSRHIALAISDGARGPVATTFALFFGVLLGCRAPQLGVSKMTEVKFDEQ